MYKKRVLFIFGTRPEAIKCCPLVKEMQKRDLFEIIVCTTGQHEQMLKQIMNEFDVQADYELHIMKPEQTLFDITTNALNAIKNVLEKCHPDFVLVQGDTTTAFVAALAAFYMKIPVGHIEAGLRTNMIYSPFPEEFNRKVISAIASFHFAPTEDAKANLIKENYDAKNIFVTGNTGVDSLHLLMQKTSSDELIDWVGGYRLILITSHRRENIGAKMQEVFDAIQQIIDTYSDIKVIFPMHLNPAVRKIASKCFKDAKRIRLVEPLEVSRFYNLMDHAFFIVTDSGGIQEEAVSLGKPVLVIRDTTERQEGIKEGIAKLIGTSKENVFQNCKALLEDEQVYSKMCKASNSYGNGHASAEIADIIEKALQNSNDQIIRS